MFIVPGIILNSTAPEANHISQFDSAFAGEFVHLKSFLI